MYLFQLSFKKGTWKHTKLNKVIWYHALLLVVARKGPWKVHKKGTWRNTFMVEWLPHLHWFNVSSLQCCIFPWNLCLAFILRHWRNTYPNVTNVFFSMERFWGMFLVPRRFCTCWSVSYNLVKFYQLFQDYDIQKPSPSYSRMENSKTV